MDNKFLRDVLLVGVGLSLATAFQGLSDLLKALVYANLFFPAGANLQSYEETEAMTCVIFIVFALFLTWQATTYE